MNPLAWIRWKVVGVLAIVGLIIYFLGLDEMALSEINTAGKESKAARWSAQDFALGIVTGNASLASLFVATTKAKEGDNVMGADFAKLDLSMAELLRRRYVMDKIQLDGPKITVKRREDGSINIEDLGEKPPGEPEAPAKKPEDWYETAKRWYEKIETWREKLPEWKRRPKPDREPGYKADYSRGVDYPFEDRPSYAVNEITSSNLRIEFEDESSPTKLPSLEQGVFTIRELSSSPTMQKEPTAFEISGLLAGTKLSLNGSLDLRGDKANFELKGDTGDLPASLVEALVGPSLPVRLTTGSIRVKFDRLFLGGTESLEAAPVLSFKGITLEPKDPRGKIAGFPAADFTKAFNEAMSELGEQGLTISDLKISGSLLSPKLDWGDSVKTLVVDGAKAFARKQAGKALDKGKAEFDKQIDKALDKVPGANVLDAKDLKDKAKDILKGVKTDDVQKTLEGGLKGIFGGGEQKADAKKADEKSK